MSSPVVLGRWVVEIGNREGSAVLRFYCYGWVFGPVVITADFNVNIIRIEFFTPVHRISKIEGKTTSDY